MSTQWTLTVRECGENDAPEHTILKECRTRKQMIQAVTKHMTIAYKCYVTETAYEDGGFDQYGEIVEQTNAEEWLNAN